MVKILEIVNEIQYTLPLVIAWLCLVCHSWNWGNLFHFQVVWQKQSYPQPPSLPVLRMLHPLPNPNTHNTWSPFFPETLLNANLSNKSTLTSSHLASSTTLFTTPSLVYSSSTTSSVVTLLVLIPMKLFTSSHTPNTATFSWHTLPWTPSLLPSSAMLLPIQITPTLGLSSTPSFSRLVFSFKSMCKLGCCKCTLVRAF